MADNQQNIPENADKLLFAEDLVGYVTRSYGDAYEFSLKAERFRNAVCNAFTENVRDATDFLIRQFQMSTSMKFEVLKAVHMDNESSFKFLAEILRTKFFRKGFEARRFLYYCAHLSSMAGKFYSFGIDEAPLIAAEAIVKSLTDYSMLSGAWDTVNSIAGDLSNMAVNSKIPLESLVRDHSKCRSPKCYSPRSTDEASEDESCQDFEKEILNNISLDEFNGIDDEWKNIMLPLLAEKEYSSSDDTSSDERSISD